MTYILVETNSNLKPSTSTAIPASSNPRSPAGRNPRTPRKVGAQATRLEAVDDSLGPLGPLGENSNISEPELPPAPPSKEQSLPVPNVRQANSSQPSMHRSMIDTTDTGDDDRSSANPRHRFNAQGQSAGIENQKRHTQPSVSIEQAARPSFDITVGDPHKVGDLTSSHIVYQVRTKVRFGGFLRIGERPLTACRHLQKPTSSPSSPLPGGIEISYGSTIHYMTATQA